MRLHELDPLYSIFEQHLLSALVEDETMDDLIVRVVSAYMGHLKAGGTMIPLSHMANLETDIRDEVMEMCRKKTYGHFNLASYRKANGIEAAPPEPRDLLTAPERSANGTSRNEKARRRGRAC